MKRVLSVIIVIITAVSMCGCLGPHSPDEYGFVLAIGVDEGENNTFCISFMLQSEPSGESGMSEGGAMIIATEADSIFSAIDALRTIYQHYLNFSHAYAVYVSKTVAQSELMERFFEFAPEVIQLRQSVGLVVTDCTAKEYISERAKIKHINLSEIGQELLNISKTTGSTPVATLLDYKAALCANEHDAIVPSVLIDYTLEKNETGDGTSGTNEAFAQPGMERSGSETSGYKLVSGGETRCVVRGCALFHNGKMVGQIDVPHTQALMLARGEFRKGMVRIIVNDAIVELDVKAKRRPSVKIDMETGKANVRIEIRAQVITDENGISDDDLGAIEREFIDEMTQKLREVEEICLRSGCDGMRLARAAKKCFSTNEEWENFDWQSFFVNTKTEFEIVIELTQNIYLRHRGNRA